MIMLTPNQSYLLQVIASFDIAAGVTQIIKAIFLDQAANQSQKYSFYRWYYGPYSKEVQSDLNELVKAGYIQLGQTKRNQPIYFIYDKEYCARIPKIPAAQIVQAKTQNGLERFLEDLYKTFKIEPMPMGTLIEFNSHLKALALSFLHLPK